ncbi:30S ribosomal protein S16 [Patescibacteria group bacterium]|nr:30S ribosomal protein S16 [Patescibacteria group bacterium]
MLHIRLTRIGKKKQPEYRFIVCEKSKDPWGKALEILGHYNPLVSPAKVEVNKDRIEHWIKNGAQCSDTVWNLLLDQGVVKGEKRKQSKISKKRKQAIEKKQAEVKKAAPAPKEEVKDVAPEPEKPAEAVQPAEEKPAEAAAE